MWKSVYGFIPVPVSFTDAMPDNTAGYARGPLIRLRPQYEDDRGLLEHELEHVRQFWRVVFAGLLLSALFALMAIGLDEPGLFVGTILAPIFGLIGHNMLYSWVDSYRLLSEVECYRIQARWYPDDRRPLFAQFIANDYRLSVSEADALRILYDA